MSGHSKWSTIKHHKAAEDNKRSAVFTKIAKKLRIAAIKGESADLNTNPFLRTVVDEARSVNMPMENIKRAVDRAMGGLDTDSAEEIVYEAYGPGGMGLMITTITDNRNRTGGEVKNILDKNGAKLGGPGSVVYLKNLVPTPSIELGGTEQDAALRLILQLTDLDDVVEVWSNLKKDV